jgi:hypothetical protein
MKEQREPREPTIWEAAPGFQRQTAATDKQIKQLVYELYGLTEGEIKIVEGEIG